MQHFSKRNGILYIAAVRRAPGRQPAHVAKFACAQVSFLRCIYDPRKVVVPPIPLAPDSAATGNGYFSASTMMLRTNLKNKPVLVSHLTINCMKSNRF
jgi:hypothetical protein